MAAPTRATAKKSLLNVGDIVNLDRGGRNLTGYEVLDMDDSFIKFRANIQFSPQTEIILIPWGELGVIGLVGVR